MVHKVPFIKELVAIGDEQLLCDIDKGIISTILEDACISQGAEGMSLLYFLSCFYIADADSIYHIHFWKTIETQIKRNTFYDSKPKTNEDLAVTEELSKPDLSQQEQEFRKFSLTSPQFGQLLSSGDKEKDEDGNCDKKA